MNRRVGVVLLFGLVTGAASLQDDPVEKEMKKLEGSWKVIGSLMNGTKIPLEAYRKVEITFKGDRITFKDASKVFEEIDFDLDPSATPKHINYVYVAGLKKGTKEQGIYELSGDQLKLCIAPSRRKRPGEFSSLPDTGHQLLTLRRQAR